MAQILTIRAILQPAARGRKGQAGNIIECAVRRPAHSRIVNVNGSLPRAREFSEIPARKIHRGRLVFANAISGECGHDVRVFLK
jgi:hypothetical protein